MPFKPGVITKEMEKLEAIYSAARKVEISKTTASKLIGRNRLEELVARGRIAMKKPNKTQTGRWYCNAADVLRYIQ